MNMEAKKKMGLDADSIADAVIKRMCEGGMVGMSDGGAVDEPYDFGDDDTIDTLSDEDDGAFATPFAEGGMVEDDKLKHKPLAGLLERIRAKHMKG